MPGDTRFIPLTDAIRRALDGTTIITHDAGRASARPRKGGTVFQNYPGGRRWTETVTLRCPNCGNEIDAEVLIHDEPRTRDYPGHFGRELTTEVACACGHVFVDDEIPDVEVPQYDGPDTIAERDGLV